MLMNDELEEKILNMRTKERSIMHLTELLANNEEYELLKKSAKWEELITQMETNPMTMMPYSIMCEEDRIMYDHILFVKWRLHELSDSKNRKLVNSLRKILKE